MTRSGTFPQASPGGFRSKVAVFAIVVVLLAEGVAPAASASYASMTLASCFPCRVLSGACCTSVVSATKVVASTKGVAGSVPAKFARTPLAAVFLRMGPTGVGSIGAASARRGLPAKAVATVASADSVPTHCATALFTPKPSCARCTSKSGAHCICDLKEYRCFFCVGFSRGHEQVIAKLACASYHFHH
eukprot:TRINITY_DN8450_c0_g2_i1.p2 TRINITY_DN8450_c0_g2~~TRINITY_DN8450_c0_g2_i1.p2  ORF type:complete len:189 (-),score=21.17 TRINITY_DN8450_c0_g2_i1:1-567(-)